MGKIVPPAPNKNGVFLKSKKTVFTVLKDIRDCFCNEKLRLYRYIFNMIKTVFVDLKKTPFLLDSGTIFPVFLTKNVPRKVGLNKLTLFSNFEKSLSE